MHEMSNIATVSGLPSTWNVNGVEMCTLTLPCEHAFNISAISWHMTRNNMQCPVCRQGVDSTLDVQKSLPSSVHSVFTQRSVASLAESDSESDDGNAVEIEIVTNGANIIDYVLNGMLPLTPHRVIDSNVFLASCQSRLAHYMHIRFAMEPNSNVAVCECTREIFGIAYRSPELLLRADNQQSLLSYATEHAFHVPYCLQRKTQRELETFFHNVSMMNTNYQRFKICIGLPSLSELRALRTNANNINIPSNGLFTSEFIELQTAPSTQNILCSIHGEQFLMGRIRHGFRHHVSNSRNVQSEFSIELAANFLVYLMDIHNLAVV